MMKAAVVGYPVEHSLSPEIFEILSKKTRVPVHYERIAISPSAFGRRLDFAARGHGFRGWNVTIPHKERAASQIKNLDIVARTLGAVNVVKFGGRSARGFNTDVWGVSETLRRSRFKCRGKTAVVFGAGGAAAAVVFALGAESIATIYLVNRTEKRARALAEKMSRRFPKTLFLSSKEVPADADLYVNATPLGMKGFPKSPTLPRFEKKVLVFDLVYRPLESQFLRSARARGARTVNGMEMLVAQAIASWEIWFGKLPSVSERNRLHRCVRRRILARLSDQSAEAVQ